MEKDIELRVLPSILSTENEDDSLLYVSGIVNETEKFSHLLGTKKRFREKIAKGTFEKALKRAKTVDFLAEHNPKYLLASTANGSLQLRETDRGLEMSATISKTSYGKDFYQLMKDKLIAHMSFGFKIRSQKWKKLIDGTYERVIYDLDLIEVSAVRNPAYPQSAISARGFTVIEDVEIDETELVEIEERAEETEQKDNSEDILSQVLSQLNTLNSEISSLKSVLPQKEEPKEETKEEVKTEEPVKETEQVENTEVKEEAKPTEVKEEIVQEVEKTETQQEQKEQIKEESPKSPDLSSYYKDLLEIYKKGE